jgi:hypothetical protein
VLWQSVRLIIADTLFVLLVTIVLMMSLQLQQWKRRHVLYALIVVLFATSVRSVGAVLSVPVITAIWGNRKWKLNPFSFVSATLFICVPVVTLVLYTLYQKQFGAHPTGYLETFFLSDPYDISKGPLTWSGFLIRTYDHAFSSATDISTAILSILPTFGNIYIGAFYFISAAVILAAACRRSGLQAATVLSFMNPYSAIAVLWPYRGPRLAIPLIPVAAMGLAEIASSISKRFARAGRIGILILFLGYVGMNMIYMAGTAHLEKTKLAEIHRNDKDLTDWYLKHIPEDAVTASFDYREHTLRLNRSVLPLYYTSDMQAQVSYLTQHKVSVLILSDAGYYLRGVYGRSLLKTLGNNAELLFKNELFEVYRLKGVF